MGRAMLAMPRGVPLAAVGVLGVAVVLGGTPPAASCPEDAVLTVVMGCLPPLPAL